MVENLRFREEEFGGVLVVYGKSPIFLNKDAFEVVLSLRGMTSFTSEEVATSLGASVDDAAGFFGSLMNKGLIERTREGVRA